MVEPIPPSNDAAAAPLLPAAFRVSRTLAGLQTVALACALSAMCGAAFSYLSDRGAIGLVAAAPTLFIALLWIGLVRMHARFGVAKSRFRWLSAVPLAAVNGAVAGGLFCKTFGWLHVPSTFSGGALLGATVGIVYWGPGLLLTMLFVGAPLRDAERRAARGLGGHDRGGRVLGLTALTITLVAATSLWYVATNRAIHHTELGADGARMERAAVVFFESVITVGVVLAVVVVVAATVREAQRAAFVRRAARGEVPRYRVDISVAGRVLVRLDEAREPYRAAAVPTSALLLDG